MMVAHLSGLQRKAGHQQAWEHWASAGGGPT